MKIVAFRHPSVPKDCKKTPLKNLVRGAFGYKKIDFIKIENLAQDRLFSKGGIGKFENISACMVGCGSLGGHLSVSLMDSGVTDFQLIDFDQLGIENIARHTCGYESVGENKVDALKRRIEQHNPNCCCCATNINACSILTKGNNIIEDSDAVFVTAADFPLEMQFVKAKINGILNKSLIIAWMEPYSLAAHAIILNIPQDIYKDGIFDKDNEFSKKVISNSSKLFKRDAGCNSTFMSYSGLDTQSFSIALTRNLFDEFLVNKNKNYHFVWIGALSKHALYKAEVSSLWKNVPDYCEAIEEIG